MVGGDTSVGLVVVLVVLVVVVLVVVVRKIRLHRRCQVLPPRLQVLVSRLTRRRYSKWLQWEFQLIVPEKHCALRKTTLIML